MLGTDDARLKQLGEALKAARGSRTASDVAGQLAMHRDTLRKVERGEARAAEQTYRRMEEMYGWTPLAITRFLNGGDSDELLSKHDGEVFRAMHPHKALGWLITRGRERLGLSVEELAQQVGLAAADVVGAERGEWIVGPARRLLPAAEDLFTATGYNPRSVNQFLGNGRQATGVDSVSTLENVLSRAFTTAITRPSESLGTTPDKSVSKPATVRPDGEVDRVKAREIRQIISELRVAVAESQEAGAAANRALARTQELWSRLESIDLQLSKDAADLDEDGD